MMEHDLNKLRILIYQDDFSTPPVFMNKHISMYLDDGVSIYTPLVMFDATNTKILYSQIGRCFYLKAEKEYVLCEIAGDKSEMTKKLGEFIFRHTQRKE